MMIKELSALMLCGLFVFLVACTPSSASKGRAADPCDTLIDQYLEQEASVSTARALEDAMPNCVQQVIKRSRQGADETRAQLIAVLVGDKSGESWESLVEFSQESTKVNPSVVMMSLMIIGSRDDEAARKLLSDSLVADDHLRCSAAFGALAEKQPEMAIKFLNDNLDKWKASKSERDRWPLDKIRGHLRRAKDPELNALEKRMSFF